ncbi:nucleoside/nucleotide kinase family protein [Caldicellulosiruptor owensensis]|nr:hypothetical protein [Caldicellulosiruptor owensensis]
MIIISVLIIQWTQFYFNSHERFERLVNKDRIEEFMKVLRDRDWLIDEFDGELWNMVVEAVKVYEGGKMVFAFKDGMEVEWGM